MPCVCHLSLCVQRISDVLASALLNNGPLNEAEFGRLFETTKAHRSLNCDIDVNDVLGPLVRKSDTMYMHVFEMVVAKICEFSDLVDMKSVLRDIAPTESIVGFMSAVRCTPRFNHMLYIQPGKGYYGRKNTKLNVCCAQNLLSNVESAHIAGVSLIELASEYEGIGLDIRNAVKDNQIVILEGRVYSSKVAISQVPGAYKTWKKAHAIYPQPPLPNAL
jgi:hypothetical protein